MKTYYFNLIFLTNKDPQMDYIIGSHQHTDSGPHKHTRHPEGPEQSPLGPSMGFGSMPLSRDRCDSCNWEGGWFLRKEDTWA